MNEQNRYDVIVVGAGALGTWHAYFSLLAGKRVLLLEKDLWAQEATVRNFGQVVASGLPADSVWHERGRFTTELYKELQAKTDIGIRANGSCYVASSSAEMAVLEELHQRFAAVDYTSELWTKDAALARYPALKPDYVTGALFFPQEVSAEPEHTFHRIQRYLESNFSDWLTLRYATPVVGVEAGSGGCEVRTADGSRYQVETCFVCSGRDARLLFPEVMAASGMVVSKLNMLATVPLKSVVLPGNILTGYSIYRYESFQACDAHKDLPAAGVPDDVRQLGIHILFKQRMDGSIIIGDSHEYAPVDRQEELRPFYNDAHINRILLREAAKIVDLPDWTIGETWCGFYAQHPDEIFMHAVDSSIHIATGIGGKGMTTGAGFSRDNVRRVLEG